MTFVHHLQVQIDIRDTLILKPLSVVAGDGVTSSTDHIPLKHKILIALA